MSYISEDVQPVMAENPAAARRRWASPRVIVSEIAGSQFNTAIPAADLTPSGFSSVGSS
jgi:hypothetical protein